MLQAIGDGTKFGRSDSSRTPVSKLDDRINGTYVRVGIFHTRNAECEIFGFEFPEEVVQIVCHALLKNEDSYL